MGLVTCMLSLMVVILITGVQSADKQLGDACTADDTCLDTTLKLTCDKLLKKCVLKVGETCNENGRKGLCVTGAACSGSTNTKCECGAGYTADATSGLCTATAQKYGGACGDACGTGLTCDTSLSLCKCETDKKPDLSDGTCEDIGNGELGKACTDGTKATACGSGSNLECPSGGDTCVCKAGYIGVLGGTCGAIGNGKIGQVCTADDKGTTCGDKATTNLDCVQSVCTCGTNYAGVTGGLCIKKVGLLGGQCSTACSDSTLTCVQNVCMLKVGETCTDNKDKCVTGAACTGDSNTKCECGTGYTAEATSGLCKKNLGVACEQDTECSDGTKTFCDKVAKKCLLKPTQSCADNTDKCSSGAACTSNKCTCDTDLTTAGADKCTPKANKVGGSCTDGSCEDSNAQCTDSVCVCKTNFSVNKQSLTCSSKAGAVVASMTLMLVATLTGLFTRL